MESVWMRERPLMTRNGGDSRCLSLVITEVSQGLDLDGATRTNVPL